MKRPLKGFSQVSDSEGSAIKQLHGTGRVFLELILPCIDKSSDESRYSFASDLKSIAVEAVLLLQGKINDEDDTPAYPTL